MNTCHNVISLQYNELVDKVTGSETKVSEMATSVEDLQWDMEKLRNREQKLNKHLAEAMEQVQLSGVVYIQFVYLCFFFQRMYMNFLFVHGVWVDALVFLIYISISEC